MNNSQKQAYEQVMAEIARKQQAERQQLKERARRYVDETLSRDELFRFGYVPVVVCRLVWDYVDTILDLCQLMRLSDTRKLCRAVKDLRSEYERHHSRYIDASHDKHEGYNMDVFEEGISDNMRLLTINIKAQIGSQYPDLQEDYRHLLVAVYQCHILLQSLTQYDKKQSAKISKRLGYKVSTILPSAVVALQPLVIEFAGDKQLAGTWQEYINTISNQIGLINYDDV